MATDYDAPRKTDEETSEESIEELKARRHDKNSGKVDEDEAVAAAALEALGGPADVVASDMAPNTTGHTGTDHLRIMGLAELALATALEALAPDGAFVAKVFQGGGERTFLDGLKRAFRAVRHAKPPASRKDSSELYVVATGFRGRGEG